MNFKNFGAAAACAAAFTVSAQTQEKEPPKSQTWLVTDTQAPTGLIGLYAGVLHMAGNNTFLAAVGPSLTMKKEARNIRPVLTPTLKLEAAHHQTFMSGKLNISAGLSWSQTKTDEAFYGHAKASGLAATATANLQASPAVTFFAGLRQPLQGNLPSTRSAGAAWQPWATTAGSLEGVIFSAQLSRSNEKTSTTAARTLTGGYQWTNRNAQNTHTSRLFAGLSCSYARLESPHVKNGSHTSTACLPSVTYSASFK